MIIKIIGNIIIILIILNLLSNKDEILNDMINSKKEIFHYVFTEKEKKNTRIGIVIVSIISIIVISIYTIYLIVSIIER
jgi:hypothetical protein